MPWAGNIAKTMMSNGKQFTVTREMLTAVARDRWNLSTVFKFCICFVLLYTCSKSLNDWSLCLGNIEILGKQNSLFPSGPVIKCLTLDAYCHVTYMPLYTNITITVADPFDYFFFQFLWISSTHFIHLDFPFKENKCWHGRHTIPLCYILWK